MLPTRKTLLQALVAARWLAFAWLAAVVAISWDDMRRPLLAATVGVVELIACIVGTRMLAADPVRLVRPAVVVADLALAVALYTIDGAAFPTGHVFGTSQNLAGQWPLLAVLHAAVAVGPWWAGVGAIPVALARYIGAAANGVARLTGKHHVSITSSVVFLGVAAGVGGTLARLLQRVETEVVARRARDDVARTLHDTVLQTLALVERRTAQSDPDLAAHARRSDRELRAYLFGALGKVGDDESLESRLRAAIGQVAQRFDASIVVNVVDDGDPVPPESVQAVPLAAAEAAANACEHGFAHRIVVFAECTEGRVFASIRDDGRGFDARQIAPGVGIPQSILGRMSDAGGRAEIDSTPGAGTEVRLWMP